MASNPPDPAVAPEKAPYTTRFRNGRGGKIFYGWWILAAATLAGTLQTAVFNAGAQTLVLPLVREFNTTRAAISIAFSLRRLEGGLTGPLEGFMIHWFGPRRYMMVGWVLFGVGFIGVGLSQDIYQFYAAFLLVTLGQSVAGFLPIVTVLVNWFRRLRGRAISIYQLGNSFGALLIPIFAWFVLNVGWRETMIAVGVIVIILGLPLASIMRPRPEDMGLMPDDDGRPADDDGRPADEDKAGGTEGEAMAQAAAVEEEEEEDVTVGQALRSRNFWFLGLSHSTSLAAWGALQVHLIPALTDIGQTEQTGAAILSLTLLVAGAGRLLGGFLGDIVGRRQVLVVACLGQAGAVVFLAFATTLTHAIIFAVTFGLMFGARGTLITVLRGDVFGRTNFSRLAGLMDPLSSASVVISPIVAGLAYDSSGSYKTALIALAAVTALGAVFALGIRPIRRR